jgi:3-ketosteroid 9alpha-monooxygenase subunit B
MTAIPASAPVAGRRPLAPAFAFPVIDLLTGIREATVLAVTAETPTIRSIRLEAPSGYTFRAGQHALLRLGTEAGPDMRPLSIASAPSEGVVEFATRIGPSAFKRAYFDLRPGDRAKVSRPMGRWTIDASAPAVVFGGGIGITPVKSVLTEAAMERQLPVRLVLSNRSAAEIPFAGELTALARRAPRISLAWHLTETSDVGPGGEVYGGRIDRAAVEREVAAAGPGAVFYVTGPDAMVRSIAGLLAEAGVPSSRVRPLAQGYR